VDVGRPSNFDGSELPSTRGQTRPTGFTDRHAAAAELTEQDLKIELVKDDGQRAGVTRGHGGGRNDKHANFDKKDAAQKRYHDAKAELEALQRRPNKTREDNEKLDQLRRQVKHLKQQADFSGENHSQRAKGNQ
jgi:small-conductance mechanosensitive channel